jgi:hypothetical protein
MRTIDGEWQAARQAHEAGDGIHEGGESGWNARSRHRSLRVVKHTGLGTHVRESAPFA